MEFPLGALDRLPWAVQHAARFAFTEVYEAAEEAMQMSLGRPLNLVGLIGVPRQLYDHQIANVGTPSPDNAYNGVNATAIEVEVIKMVRKLWIGEGQALSGYVTPGGSESNNLGAKLGRVKCLGAPVLFNAAGHYSVARATGLVGIPNERRVSIAADTSGAISLVALEQKLEELRVGGLQSVIVMLTCGTTFTEGHDNIGAVLRVLDGYGFGTGNRYVHVDAALCGFFLPFASGIDPDLLPGFHHAINSMCASGHKYPGTKAICSVFMGRDEDLRRNNLAIEYIGGTDFTLSCTRNAQPIMQLYVILLHYLYTGYFGQVVAKSINMANTFAMQLIQSSVPTIYNPFAITVTFPQPPDELCEKYSLVSQEGMSHIITMPHVTELRLSEFCQEYVLWFTGQST